MHSRYLEILNSLDFVTPVKSNSAKNVYKTMASFLRNVKRERVKGMPSLGRLRGRCEQCDSKLETAAEFDKSFVPTITEWFKNSLKESGNFNQSVYDKFISGLKSKPKCDYIVDFANFRESSGHLYVLIDELVKLKPDATFLFITKDRHKALTKKFEAINRVHLAIVDDL